jgi:predicted HD superfamily hydrolase involved in NAD metabolism
MIGIPSAIALGAVAGKAEKGLDCLEDLTEEDLEKARKFIEERRYAMRPAHTFEIIYIEIEASLGEHEARVLIAKESTHFVYLKTDNKVLLDERYTLAKTYDRCHESDLNMQLIWDFVTAVPLEQIQFLLDGARENQKIAEMAFSGDYGLNLGKMLKMCEKAGVTISEYERNSASLLHSKAGAVLAESRYGVSDEDILNAIRYHTTGRPGMSLLEKIVFVADYIEPGRDSAPNLPVVRKLAYESIDDCVLQILKDTLRYLATTGADVDPMTHKTYEYYRRCDEERKFYE